jgi:quercetin dioxygenase-like cupin family protein
MALKKKQKAAQKESSRAQLRPTVSDTSGDDLGAAEMNRRVSEALKRMRKARNLSLDQLAAKSEGARTNPTLSVLWKIAAGLEVAFQELLEMPEESNAKLLRSSDTVALRSADGRMESRLLSPGGAAPGVELYELKLAPKAVHKSEPHGKGTTETVVVLKGTLRILVDSSEYELLAGDTLYFSSDVPHSYENRSSHEARFLNVINYERI